MKVKFNPNLTPEFQPLPMQPIMGEKWLVFHHCMIRASILLSLPVNHSRNISLFRNF